MRQFDLGSGVGRECVGMVGEECSWLLPQTTTARVVEMGG